MTEFSTCLRACDTCPVANMSRQIRRSAGKLAVYGEGHTTEQRKAILPAYANLALNLAGVHGAGPEVEAAMVTTAEHKLTGICAHEIGIER